MDENLIWPDNAATLPFLIMARQFFLPFNKKGWKRLFKVLDLTRKYVTNAGFTFLLQQANPYPLLEEEVIIFVDGEKAKPLADKYTFVDILAKMKKGYVTPKQMLVRYKTKEIEKILAQVNSWKVEKVFCKPIGGENAHGIKIVAPHELADLIPSFKSDYVIEEAMPLIREFRWAISRGKDGVVRRLCFEKIRPYVVGDGKTNLGRLMLKNKKMTLRSKTVNLFRKLKELNKVVADGEKYYLTLTGNPPAGSFEHVIRDKKLLEPIDKYMLELVSDLERYLDTGKLFLLCFDVGILDEELEKKSFVPIECQMPFGAWAYFGHYKDSLTRFLYFYYSVL